MWLMSMNQSSTPYLVIGLSVATVAIAGLLMYLKKRGTKIVDPREQTKRGGKEENLGMEKGFSNQLFLHLKSFSGSLNPLADIANKDFDASFAQIIFDNIEQIIRFHGDEDDKKRFIHDRKGWGKALYKAKAREILDVIQSYRVTPVKEDEVVWDEALLAQYMRLTSVEKGQTCEVVAPYWVFNGEVFEKGVVKSKEV